MKKFLQDEEWGEAGRRESALLESLHSVLITGPQRMAVASVALGIADELSPTREIVIANLLDFPGIDRLTPTDDENISVFECFAFGISLRAAAIPLEDSNIRVIRGGTERYDTAEVLSSQRWAAFARSLAASNGLLVVLAPSNAEGIAELATQLDGVIVVDTDSFSAPSNARILTSISLPETSPSSPSRIRTSAPASEEDEEKEEIVLGEPEESRPNRIWLAFLIALGLILLLGAGWWAMQRYDLALPGLGKAKTKSTVAQPIVDSVPPPLVQPLAGFYVSNTMDSAVAARYSIEVLTANTQNGAIASLQKFRNVQGTVSPTLVEPDSSIWYKVNLGAFTDSAQADSLLQALRRRRALRGTVGDVVVTPYAFVIQTLPADSLAEARKILEDFKTRNVSVYQLLQDDGTAKIYSGAFATPTDAKMYGEQLRASGLNPVLAYRTGKSP